MARAVRLAGRDPGPAADRRPACPDADDRGLGGLPGTGAALAAPPRGDRPAARRLAGGAARLGTPGADLPDPGARLRARHAAVRGLRLGGLRSGADGVAPG